MEKVTIPPFAIIGISVRTTNENTQAAKDIPVLWERFFREQILSAIPNKIDNTVYCLYTEYVKDHTEPYTAILGCKVEHLDTIPDGMIGKFFEGGEYIHLSARGDLMNGLVGNKWFEIWNMDLPRVFTVDYEVYGAKTANPADAEVDFFIAV